MVSGTQRPRLVALRYLFPAITTAIRTVTITASDVAKFADERVGLRLSINGVKITFPIAWTSAQIDNAIEVALGGAFNASDTAFGVFKVGCEQQHDPAAVLATCRCASGIMLAYAVRQPAGRGGRGEWRGCGAGMGR